MASAIFELKRGDKARRFFKIPSDAWEPGSTLRFVAKAEVDDDVTDARAGIDKTFHDDSAIDDGETVTYTLDFVGDDTKSVNMNGDEKVDLKGEFQLTPPGGDPVSYPGTNKYIKVIVYADIARQTP